MGCRDQRNPLRPILTGIANTAPAVSWKSVCENLCLPGGGPVDLIVRDLSIPDSLSPPDAVAWSLDALRHLQLVRVAGASGPLLGRLLTHSPMLRRLTLDAMGTPRRTISPPRVVPLPTTNLLAWLTFETQPLTHLRTLCLEMPSSTNPRRRPCRWGGGARA